MGLVMFKVTYDQSKILQHQKKLSSLFNLRIPLLSHSNDPSNNPTTHKTLSQTLCFSSTQHPVSTTTQNDVLHFNRSLYPGRFLLPYSEAHLWASPDRVGRRRLLGWCDDDVRSKPKWCLLGAYLLDFCFLSSDYLSVLCGHWHSRDQMGVRWACARCRAPQVWWAGPHSSRLNLDFMKVLLRLSGCWFLSFGVWNGQVNLWMERLSLGPCLDSSWNSCTLL